MCLLCVEIAKERMTRNEFLKAISEMTIPEEHLETIKEVAQKAFNNVNNKAMNGKSTLDEKEIK